MRMPGFVYTINTDYFQLKVRMMSCCDRALTHKSGNVGEDNILCLTKIQK